MPKDSLELLCKQAQDALTRGQYQDARQIYQQALGYRNDSPEVHYGIATACFLLGDTHSSVYHFKEVIRLDPLRAGAFINLGAVYNRLGQLEDALTTLRRGIQLDANRAEGYYNIALVYRQLGQLDMAVNAYREAVRLNPKMYDAHYNLGNIFLEKGQHVLAIAHYKHALDIRPNWEKGRNALEAAQAAKASLDSGDAQPEAPPAIAPPSKLDPDRLIDPNFHGKLLRDLHTLVVDADTQSQAMLEFLQKEVENAIRELSISILTPNDPKYNLDDQIRRFDEMTAKLNALQAELQKSMTRTRIVGEQVAKI
ncbi:MAG TPA: tetratricopeptide repeat protein [Gemmataceae bacterium]|nr:tetratricopeptide repeat protein [Gemmataceae bacterium]